MNTALAEAIKKRDEAVLADLDTFIAFAASQGQQFSTRHVAEITQHKMRTAIVTLPVEVRAASKQWLTERGYRSLDDGEL